MKIFCSSRPGKSFFGIVAIAALAIGLPSGTRAQTPDAPQPKTKTALACMLGMAPKGCLAGFGAAAVQVSNRISWRGGANPYFRSADYLWSNDAGDEVWDVKFMHSEMTYVISPPNADGKVLKVSIMQGAPQRQCDNTVSELMAGGRQSCRVFFRSS